MNPDSADQADSTRSSRRTAVFCQHQHQRHASARSRRWYILKAAAFLLVVLAAGVVIGVSGTLYFVKDRMHRQPRAEQLGQSILDRLSERVALTRDEKARLEQLVTSRMDTVEVVRQDTFARIRQEFDSMNDDIDGILGPERSAAWEKDKEKRYGRYYRSKEERHTHPSRRESGHR